MVIWKIFVIIPKSNFMKAYPKYKDSGVESIGEIPFGWQTKRLKRFAKIYNGKDQKDVIVSKNGFPILGTGGEFGRASKFLYDKPSVLLGRKGTIDKPIYINEPFWTVDTLYYTEILPQTNPKYFFFLCKTIAFDKYKTGSAVPSMTQEDLNEIVFPAPSIQEQTHIAKYLDCKTQQIDGLIAKKKQLIAILKEERTAIINQAVTKGLDPNVPMKDSGIKWLGEIPEHWEIKRLKYISKIVLGKMLTNEDKGGYQKKPYLRAQNINWFHVNYSNIKEMWFSNRELEKYRVRKNDLLVSEGGEVGRTCIWKDEIPECYIQNSVHKVTFIKSNNPKYFLNLLF